MRLDFIPLDKLSVSRTNMRHGRKAPDVTDILPTVRKRGVIQPLIVRPNCGPDAFEIVAGRRRFTAATIVAEERRAAGEDAEPLPCAILEPGDDAAALEISMIENMARLDADEVTQWESFTRLVKEGQCVDDIAATFGLPELAVKRILALGNLLPPIRDLYRKERIDRATVRHLTLASKSQQKAWLALADDPNAYAPSGHQLKAWLFGGQSIPTKNALFDLGSYPGQIVADLFGEGGFFGDAESFWTAQNEAIEARRAAYLADGWSDVVTVPATEHFHTWEYEKAAKRKGGRVYVDVRRDGEVTFHEGYISRKEAARAARAGDAEAAEKPARPEITATMQTYIDLHRHAAVRATLIGHPQVALRLMVAHAIGGSPLWSVKPDLRSARGDAVAESVEGSKGEAELDTRRRAVLALLGFDAERPTVVRNTFDDAGVTALLLRLLDLPDRVVMEVLTMVMAETLASGSAVVEAVGLHLGVAMQDWWEADAAFFASVRDREVLAAIVAEVAGELVARANRNEKSKTLKAIVRDHLEGSNGRDKVEGWVPRWMGFPPAAYTTRGGVGTVSAHARAEAARVQPDEPDPDTPAPDAALSPMRQGEEEYLAPANDEDDEDALAA